MLSSVSCGVNTWQIHHVHVVNILSYFGFWYSFIDNYFQILCSVFVFYQHSSAYCHILLKMPLGRYNCSLSEYTEFETILRNQ